MFAYMFAYVPLWIWCHRGQNKAPDRLELEFQVAVSCRVDAGAEQEQSVLLTREPSLQTPFLNAVVNVSHTGVWQPWFLVALVLYPVPKSGWRYVYFEQMWAADRWVQNGLFMLVVSLGTELVKA